MSKIVLRPDQSSVEVTSYGCAELNIKFVIPFPIDKETENVLRAIKNGQSICIDAFGPSMRDEIRHEMEKEKQKAFEKEEHKSDPNWGTW